MSASNSPQTLFRFVSLRNPKLAETKKTNLGFIQRPDGMEGVFDQVVQTNTNSNKFEALKTAAAAFEPEAIKTESELENIGFGELLKIAKLNVAPNKLSATNLKLCKACYQKFNNSTESIKKLWDNLIYQAITQKDFYIKEHIAHIIKALHIGYAQTLVINAELRKINGNSLIIKGIDAKIVLPYAIFETNNSTPTTKRSSTQNLLDRDTSVLAIVSEKNQTEQDLSFQKDIFINLKTELEVIQKRYNTTSSKAFKIALQNYTKENATNKNAYEQQLSVIEELEINKATAEEIKKAYEVLKKYEIPPFEFNYKSELNWEDIYKNLSPDSFGFFLKHFSDAQEIKFKHIDYNKAKISIASDDEINIDGNSIFFLQERYSEIIEIINSQIKQFDKHYLSKVSLQQDKFVNLGGVLVPIAKNSNQVVHLSYILKAYKPTSVFTANTNLGYASLQIQVENASWSINQISINAQTNVGAQIENIGKIEVIDNSINLSQFLKNKFGTIDSLSIQIFFSNGRESTLDLSGVTINTNLTGVLVLKPFTEISNANKDVSKGEETSFTGKHFGLKRLGVAEYLKVVQTIHAYVPGEVSNIENVMASELRHKSINELTRTEDTVTTTKSQEIEKISDTTKTNRAEMQTEVAKEIDRQQSFQAHANFSYDAKLYKLDLGTAYASTNAQHISNMQAVTKSQEITERAMERVQSKITEERISKIIQEISLTNVHEFDNRGGALATQRPQHITGVYRWVDKKMKNQIYNYGKRTMFEFMIPEPAKLHRLALATQSNVLAPPIDPRTAPTPHTMTSATSSTNELLEYWAGIYGVNLAAILPNAKQIIHNASGVPQTNDDFQEGSSFVIPEHYAARNGIFSGRSSRNRGGGWSGARYSTLVCSNLKGDLIGGSWSGDINFDLAESGMNVIDNVNFTVSGHNVSNYNVKTTINCELSVEYINAWKLENFNLIIEAYTKALQAYNEKIAAIEAAQKAKEGEQKESQANFYRIIEGDLLKHNCIAYLLQDYLTTLGQKFTDGDKMENFQVYLNDNLDQYTALAKFLEQAFEWSIKDYTFYPYFWADRKQWQEMYLSQSIDPLFRSFLQAGLARVIVTVKPGFEEAVQYFLTTGQVWFGGETPVIGDPLYMSIVQEMQEPVGVPQGNYWITRIPTTLTILQAKSTGLDVVDPLPIFPESHPENCENPAELETATVFKLDDVQMVASERATTLHSN
jgi:hypothetical protein